jgi:hypothetical protein
MIPRAYLLAVVWPVAFMLTVLAAWAANGRSARGPTVLTEREAPVRPRTSDRAIAEVWLGWTEPAGAPGAWMTRDDLTALGFDVSVDPGDPRAEEHYRRQLSRRAFVAFELDGPAWAAVLAQRQAAPPVSDVLPRGVDAIAEDGLRFASRLVPVAIAPDARTLAERFTNPRTHLVTAAVVRVARFDPPLTGGTSYIGGMLRTIDPARIQVPSSLAASLPMSARADVRQSRYTVSLMYGARWEPWVMGVAPAEQGSSEAR